MAASDFVKVTSKNALQWKEKGTWESFEQWPQINDAIVEYI